METKPEPRLSSNPSAVAQTVGLRQIVVTIGAKRHNPSILNPDFLKINQIVPSEWELAESPICVEPHSEVSFTNGIKIVAEFEAISFSEAVNPDNELDLCVPSMAKSYIELLPHVDYTGAGIEIRGDISMSESEVDDFFFRKLVRRGTWNQIDGRSARVGLRVYYPIENGHLILTIAPAAREAEEGRLLTVLFFGGILRRQANAEDQPRRFGQVLDFISHWSGDIDLYLKVVNERFLAEG